MKFFYDILRHSAVNAIPRFYNYFILTFTSSIPFYIGLLCSTVFVIVGTLFFNIFLGTLAFIGFLLFLHGMHGVLHILSDYIYNTLVKKSLITCISLILLKGSTIIFLI